MIDDDALLDEFVIESNEHLESIEEELLELEAQGADLDTELVNKVFRSVHSIKGGAGFLGLTAINKLSHTMESVLDRMRDNELIPTKANINALLGGADMLKRMMAAPSTGTDEDSVADIIERIKAQDGAAPAPESPPPSFHDHTGKHVKVPQPSSSEWVVRPAEHQHIYLLQIDDLKEYEVRTGRSPIGMLEDLTLTGTIISQRFVADALDLRTGVPDRKLTLEILYASLFAKDMIAESVGLPADAVTPLEADQEEEARREMRATPVMSDAPPREPARSQAALEPSTPSPESIPDPKPIARPEPMPDQTPSMSVEAPMVMAPTDEEIRPPIHEAPSLEMKASGGASVASGADAAKRQVVRVNLELLDRLMSLAGELVLVRNRHLQMVEGLADEGGMTRKLVNQLNAVTNELQDAVMRTRMQQVGVAFAKLPRMVRDLSQKLSKEIELVTTGNEVELDKTILEALADPLTHLIRNACDHGVETPQERIAAGKPALGHIEVAARHEAGQIVIEIHDDGGGINPGKVGAKAVERGLKQPGDLESMNERDLVNLIMMPGFSTAEALSDVSGRGVGMDVVRSSIENLGGTIMVESVHGEGSVFRMRLPLTLAIISSLIVRAGERRYAIPQVNLEEIVTVYRDDLAGKLEYANNQTVYRLRDHMLPLVFLDELFGSDQPFDDIYLAEQTAKRRTGDAPEKLTFVVVKMGEERFGVVVDGVVGSEDIVVKPMHPALKSLRCYAGSTILGDGSVALILDIVGISDHANVDLAHHVIDDIDDGKGIAIEDRTAQLFFTLGGKERFALPLPLIRRIVTFERDQLEEVGGKPYVQIDDMSLRVLNIDKHIPVSRDKDLPRYHLILPRHIYRPVGFLAAELVDVGSDYPMPDPDAYIDPAVHGASIVDGHTTLFLDMFHLAEQEEPSWFHEEEKQTIDPSEVPKEFGQGKKVMLAEDVGFFRRMLGGYLQAAGFEVTTAKNGREAYDQMQRHDFDVLVSDIEMPEMDGNQLIRAVRKGQRNVKIPSMALSALSKESDRARSLKAGFDAYEIKVDRERMYQSLYEMLLKMGQGVKR
ncbi:MAG: hybrid sensor histidine kinase/response regulator [Planctomycetota bacterium]|jgi:two-component system chemotaxis sensor kinase CheA|nr:hybrid sensor histidine kinase/response regulator [Planctomycetota bacterium]